MIVDSFTALFATHQEVILAYRYPILLVVALIEGTGTMIATGALVAAGVFEWPYALLTCTIAEILDGFVWYSVGYFFGARPIEYFVRKSPARQAFMAAIQHHAERAAGAVILAVKMTYSVTNPTLILIGSLKYPVKRYAVYNIIGSVGWATMLISLGYFFGHAAAHYLRAFRWVGLTVFIVVCSGIALIILKESGNRVLARVKRTVQKSS